MKSYRLLILFVSYLVFISNIKSFSQVIVIDAGHGYNPDCSPGDGRSVTEINTNHAVSLKLRDLLQANCTWSVFLTRPNNNCGSQVSINDRWAMANSWNADRILSIHCNAGQGTGTETFWCNESTSSNTTCQAFATEVQSRMVQYGSWVNRRVVEDNSYLGYHLGVLRYANAPGCLNEIGFVDYPPDAAKLLDDSWRNLFANAYYIALQNHLNISCGVCTPPTNDNCSSSIPTLPVSPTCTYTAGNIACATQSVTAISCPSGLIQDVWYKFTANSNGTYTVRLDPSSGMDGVVEVRQNSCTGNVIGCADSGGGNGAVENLNINVTSGTTYYVRVYEYNSAGNSTPPTTTTFDICVIGSTTQLPDLIITAGTQSLSTNTVAGGSNITAYASLDNQGSTSAGATNVGLWLAAGSTLNTNTDIFLGSITGYPNLAANSNSTIRNATVSIPCNTPAGNYRVFFWADNGTCGSGTNCSNCSGNVNESNECNNFASVYPLTVTACCTPPSSPTSATATFTTINQGQSTQLQVNGGALNSASNWIWYTGSCGGTQVGTGSTLSVSPSTTTTYYVQASACNVTTTCRSVTINVVSCTPPISPSSASASQTTINAGQATTLQVNGGTLNSASNWIWYTGSCGGTQVGTGSTLAVSPTVTTTYYVQASACNTTTTCRSVTINVVSCTPPVSPSSVSASQTTINAGQSTTLQVNGGVLNSASNWIWYTGSCGGTQVGTGTTLAVSPNVTTTYYVQASACNVTTSCQSVTINVVSCTPPVSPSSASASQTTINAGQSTTLQVNGGALNSASNWIWYTGSCGGTQVGTGTTLAVSPNVTTTYYVQASACNTTTTCRSVTINVVSCTPPLSPSSASASQTTINAGQSTTLQVNGGALNSASNWIWYTGSCGGTQVGTGTTLVVSPNVTTTYYVQASACNVTTSCQSVTITVNSNCLPPTVQASGIVFNHVGPNSIRVLFNAGNGEKRIVKMNVTNSFSPPVNGTDPIANSNYTGSGEQVIYNGTDWGVDVTGLNPNTNYCFRVYEYNCSGGATIYLTSEGTNNPRCNFSATNCSTVPPPINLSPGSTTYPGPAVSGNISFNWSTTGANNYRFELRKEPFRIIDIMASSCGSSGPPITTTHTYQNGVKYRWTVTSVQGSCSGGCQTVSADYYFTYDVGCTIPGPVTVSGGGTFCNSTILTASGGAGGTIYWQGTNANGTNLTTASTTQTVTSSGTYYFRSYHPTCGWGPQGSATVTIENPVGPLTVNGGGTFCNNAVITAVGGTGGTIYWQGTNSNGTSTSTPSASQTVSASGTYYFRAYNSCGWGPSVGVTVVINVPPACGAQLPPDLTSSQFFSSLQITNGSYIDEVVVIRNVGSGPTTAPIVFGITNYNLLTGLSVSLNPASSVTIGPETYILDNINWTFDPVAGTFTSNAGVGILPGGTKNIGIRFTRTGGANGTVNQTTTIAANTGGGDITIANNSISNIFLKY